MSETHNLLRKLNLERTPDAAKVIPPVAEEVEDIEESPAYGWLRGVRDRGTMLELRFKTGSSQSIGYPWLFKADFDPSQGIVLNFTSYHVTIAGRNLRGMYDLVKRHRVIWVQETDSLRDNAPDSATVITSIKVIAVQKEPE